MFPVFRCAFLCEFHSDQKQLFSQMPSRFSLLKRRALFFRDDFELQCRCQYVHGIVWALTDVKNFKLKSKGVSGFLSVELIFFES
jgi:hypothetical protein